MTEYHKIDSVYLRDPATNHRTFLEGQYAQAEFDFLSLNNWMFTEKIDGTNIRVIVDADRVRFGGRTDKASIPAPLVSRLKERFLPQTQKLREMFSAGAVLYGEGYGARIQKGGGNYRPDQDFVLFDVRCGDWWLQRSDVEEIARILGLDVVPVIGRGTLIEMVEMTRAGFRSIWGDFEAEGIVARPATELKTRAGRRIITKVKHKDFQ